MFVRLFCPKCAAIAAARKLASVSIDVPVPIARLSDSGLYEVHCDLGHTSVVALRNLKFELLFEMGLNAIVDGYPREAVSSFTSSLERFNEFYWRVVMAHWQIPKSASEDAWKLVARLSERQLGAFITAALMLTKRPPPVLNQNREVQFRNDVIHNGYVPTDDEAIRFGDSVKIIINDSLEALRCSAQDALVTTYNSLLPELRDSESRSDDDHAGAVNLLTTIDVLHPATDQNGRSGDVRSQLPRIARERERKRMWLLTEDEMTKWREQHPGVFQATPGSDRK